MHSAIVARVGDRNPMGIADDLGPVLGDYFRRMPDNPGVAVVFGGFIARKETYI